MDQVHQLGPLHIQFNWDWRGWYYTNRKGEQVNMAIYVGTVIPPEGDTRLYQIVLGPFMANWAWVWR